VLTWATSLGADAATYGFVCVVFALAGAGVLRALRVPLDSSEAALLGAAVTQACWTCVAGLLIIAGVPLRVAAAPLWVLTAALAAFGGIALRGARQAAREQTGWPLLVPLGLSLVLPVAAMAPYLGAGLIAYRGSGLPDGWSYIAAGQYFWQFPRGTEDGIASLYEFGSVFSYMRNAASSELALLSPAALPGQAHSTAGLFQALTLFALFTSSAAFARARGVTLGRASLYLVCLGASGWIANLVWANNYDHGLALAYAPALAGLCTAVARPTAGTGAAVGLILAALTYTYPEMGVLIVVAAMLASTDRMLRSRPTGWVALSLCAAVVWLVLAGPAFRDMYWFFLNQVNALQATVRPGEGMFTGLVNMRALPSAFWALGAEHNATTGLHLQQVAGVLLTLLFAVGVARLTFRREFGIVLGLGLLLAAAGAFIVYQSYSYGAYKLILTSWWLIAFALISGWEWLASLRRSRLWAGVALATCLLLPGSVLVRGILLWRHGPPPSPTFFRDVEQLEHVLDGQPVGLAIDDVNASYWAIYFLRQVSTKVGKFDGYLAAPQFRRVLERAEPTPWHKVRYVLTGNDPPGSINGRDGWTAIWRGGAYTLWDTGGAPWAIVTGIEGGTQAVSRSGLQLDDRPTRVTLLAGAAGQVALRGVCQVSSVASVSPAQALLIVGAHGSTATQRIDAGRCEVALPVVPGENTWTIMTAVDPTATAISAPSRRPTVQMREPRVTWASAAPQVPTPAALDREPTGATSPGTVPRPAQRAWVPNLRAMFTDSARYMLVCLVLLLAGRALLWLLPVPMTPTLISLLAPSVGHAWWAVSLGMLVLTGIPVKLIAPPLWLATACLAALGIRAYWTHELRGGATGAFSIWCQQTGVWLVLSAMLPVVMLLPSFVFGFADYPGSRLPDGWAYVAYGAYLWDFARGTGGSSIPLYQFGTALSHTRYISSSELGLLSLLTASGNTQTAVSLLQAIAAFCFASACLAFGWTRALRAWWLLAYGVLAVVSGWTLNVIWAANFDNFLALAYFPAFAGLARVTSALSPPAAGLFGFLAAALIYVYPEFAPLVLACASLLVIERLGSVRERGWLAGALIAAAVCVVLSGPYFKELTTFLRAQTQVGLNAAVSGVGKGMFLGLVTPGYQLPALWALGAEHQVDHLLTGQRLIAIGLTLLTIVGAFRLWTVRERGLIAVACVMASGIAMFALHRAYGYGTYKVLLLSWWLGAFVLVSGAQWLGSIPGRGRAMLLIAAGIVLASIPLTTAVRLAFQAAAPHLSMARFRSLEEVARLHPREPVAIFVEDGEASQWALYYMRQLPIQIGKWTGYPAQAADMRQAPQRPWREFRFVLTDDIDPGPVQEQEGWRKVWHAGAFSLWDTGRRGWAIVADVENPNGIDRAPDPWLWLGGGETRLTVIANRAGRLSLGAGFILGPSAPPSLMKRSLQIVTSAGSEETVTLPGGASSFVVPVSEGRNVYVLTPLDAPTIRVQPNGDVRSLILGMRSPTLSWEPAPGASTQ
jgi:hypothetical protein